MNNELAGNIRAFRKARGLTQEKLAEVFGVTVGAVHKWEAGLSTPDLSLILELADFFDTSLDVLIGFEARDNRTGALAARIRKMSYEMDPEGPSEAEKALKKYPHNFAIVFECALLYGVYGINPRNDKYLERSKALFDRSLMLISQNTDPAINETVIYAQLAIVNQAMGDTAKALEIYKSHNAGGTFDVRIGQILAQSSDYKNADVYFSNAMVKLAGDKLKLITGKIMCSIGNKDYQEARALIDAGLKDNAVYRRSESPCVLDKYDSFYLTALAFVELKDGNKKKASDCLKKAKKIAERFDKDPDYDVRNIRFIDINESLKLHDTMGKTCMDTIENAVESLKSSELEKLWKTLK